MLSDFWHLLTSVDAARVKAIALESSWLAMLICFFSGILTSLTPCVYPMIPITINIFGRLSHERGNKKTGKFDPHTFGLSAVYVAGMCVTYSGMGLIAGLTGSLFGKILQSNYMLGFLTLLFMALALGQLGLFKVALPSSLQTRLSQIGNAQSVKGIFAMGLLSGLIVSPCVGPVIAGILAFVVDTSNAWKGLLYFFSFSLGLGILFLLIGGFSGLLSKLPRSGTWMTRVNRILALLMLVTSGYYGSVWFKQMGWFGTPAVGPQAEWLWNEDAALQLALSSKKPMVVDFTAIWCEACHVIDETVLKNPKVTEELKNFVTLRIDVSEETDVTAALLKKYGVLSLPTIVFLNRSGTLLGDPRVHGILSPEEFMTVLRKVAAISK